MGFTGPNHVVRGGYGDLEVTGRGGGGTVDVGLVAGGDRIGGPRCRVRGKQVEEVV